MIFLFPSPSPPPPHWQPVFYSSPFILYWRRLTSSPSLHFSLRPMWFPQRIFHTFRKMNESWSLRWCAKLSGALDKMIESQTKSYTDKLQDITCARACSHLRLANTSRRFQCACSGDMKTLKLPSSHSPRHSLGHSIGQTDNTLGSAANSRNAQGSTSKRL